LETHEKVYNLEYHKKAEVSNPQIGRNFEISQEGGQFVIYNMPDNLIKHKKVNI
jgi:hypothetical protein